MPTIISGEKPAGTTRIHCPACRQRDIPAKIVERAERVTQYSIHLTTYSTWWVVCSGCNARLYSRISGAELLARTADQLVGVVIPRVMLYRQVLAVASVVLATAPFLGLGIGIVAYLVNRKSPGWLLTVSKVGLWITGLLHLGLALTFVMLSVSARK